MQIYLRQWRALPRWSGAAVAAAMAPRRGTIHSARADRRYGPPSQIFQDQPKHEGIGNQRNLGTVRHEARRQQRQQPGLKRPIPGPSEADGERDQDQPYDPAGARTVLQ
jgi:hypothetical protein